MPPWIHLYKNAKEEHEHWRKVIAEQKFYIILDSFGEGQIRYFYKAFSKYNEGLLYRHKRQKKVIFTTRSMVRELIAYVFEDRRSLNTECGGMQAIVAVLVNPKKHPASFRCLGGDTI